MGYRSDVAILASKEEVDNCIKRDPNLWKETVLGKGYAEVFKTVKKPEGALKDGLYYYWFFDYIKWYLTYDEIKLTEEFIRTLQHYAFVRIGEDGECDIEKAYKGFAYCPFNIRVEIDNDFEPVENCNEDN